MLVLTNVAIRHTTMLTNVAIRHINVTVVRAGAGAYPITGLALGRLANPAAGERDGKIV